MKIYALTPDEIEYLARVLQAAHDRSAIVRVSVDGGLKIAMGGGMWTPPMGDPTGPDGWPLY